MDYEWDEAKSRKCLAERGFDFAFVTCIFDGRFIAFEDARFAYGETRMNAIGMIDGLLYTVTYTDCEGHRRIVSAHRSSRQEKRIWRSFE